MDDLDLGNLLLTRKESESIIIGDYITITVLKIDRVVGGRVYFSIRAPKSVAVHREEVAKRIKEEKGNVI